MNLSEALADESFDEKTREKIGLTVAESASRTLFRKSLVQASWMVAGTMINRYSREALGLLLTFSGHT